MFAIPRTWVENDWAKPFERSYIVVPQRQYI